jgi:putative ABC transport system ATP-binding protein
VAAARALIHSPRLLIADEPTSSLDEANKHEFIELLFDIADEHTTILFVSHDQSLARHFDTKISLQEINQV